MIKIAFASCCRYEAFPHIPHELKQPEWKAIQDVSPDYLFLLGDNIYMDYGVRFFSQEPVGSPEKLGLDAFEIKMNAKYSQQFSVPNFKNLISEMRTKNALFATWDDHDFAWDNACGNEVPDDKKVVSTNLFKKWVLGQSEPDNSPIYRYVDLPENNPIARFIILDNRSYSERINLHSDGEDEFTSASEGKSMLGVEQLTFLLEKMQHDLPHTFICAGLSLTQGSENWSKYEEEYDVFSQAVDTSNSNVFYVAGDIHKNKLLKPNFKRPCYEVISSGISINYLGLPADFDDCHNWGIIEFDINQVSVQFNKAKINDVGGIQKIKSRTYQLLR
ncbi:alkaline phosphatase D family protein [Shewanella sp. SR44-3]|uniref:alkaline phosphatase D family protein n=1 Tax=Shewanella sp. SR44-3 TaxID=2760936 RepID=UPI0015F99972|nr:alkaline phosphatase D family protein [Shewanella sp. SR44-3]MBB1270912.1 alkaline phosphatase D family protein [Shewanella sp. SR44-3]